MQKPITLEALTQMLAELGRAYFWGSLQIDFQNGQIILVRKTETMKSLESFKGNTHANFNK